MGRDGERRWWCAPLAVLVLLWTMHGSLAVIGDPYKLLGVERSASQPEIRRAYKQLAKEWHPDKSDDPAAEGRFVEMKQAYELLSDPERRKLYDLHGITDEDSAGARPDYSFYGHFGGDPLDELLAAHGGRFHFQEHDITALHRMAVTARQFENNLVHKSAHTPHLLLVYTDWCFPCLQATPIWRRLVDTLEPLGVALATLHAGREPALARRLGVHGLPCLVLLLDGAAYVYKEHLNGVQRVSDFIRSKLPHKLVPTLDDAGVADFLAGWRDNRVRALVFERQAAPRLRYLIAAYHFRERVAFGTVQLSSAAAADTARRHRVPVDMDTVLLFNEDAARPVAAVSMADIPGQTLQHVLDTHQFLALPRLSSQRVLDALCPAEWSRPRKRLCAVLVTGDTVDHDGPRDALRRFAVAASSAATAAAERVRFAYVFHERQAEWVAALRAPAPPLLRIVIIWRRDTSHLKYEWLDGQWHPERDLNSTQRRLEQTLARLLRSSEALSGEAVVRDLLDEHAQGVFGRLLARLLVLLDVAYEGLTRDQMLPVLSLAATVLFIVAAGYLMAHLVRLEEESVQRQRAASNNNNSPGAGVCGDSVGAAAAGLKGADAGAPRELNLHELRAEKYNGLVRLLKPGCRTLVLCVDAQSRLQLIPAFHRAVWPYRKNKTLQFAHMSLERGLGWYRELLQLSLPEPRRLEINPRNCVGTVLALNGHRKYFCMFHAKHAETSAAARRRDEDTEGARHRRPGSDDPELGALIGLEDESDGSSSDSDAAAEVLLQGSLLDALPNWLDRLFEGTTRRYYINYWPDFPTK